MSLKFLHDNLILQSNIFVQNENKQFPIDNLKDPRRTKVFKSTTNEESIVFDLKDIREIDTVMLVDSGKGIFGFNQIKIQLNNTDSWLAPPIEVTPDIDFNNGIIFYSFSNVENYRWVRLVLSHETFPVEVSKVFIGKAYSNTNVCFAYPIEYSQSNRAVVTTNKIGQKFFDEITTIKQFKGTIPSLDKDEVEEFIEVLDNVSYTKPIWVIFNALNIFSDANRISGYYFLTKDPNLSVEAGNYWTIELEFEEGQ